MKKKLTARRWLADIKASIDPAQQKAILADPKTIALLEPGPRHPTIVDRAFWLEELLAKEPSPSISVLWLKAIAAIDEDGRRPKGALIELLRSDTPLSPLMRNFLADLIDRYNLKRPQGRQRVPAYDKSEIDAVLLVAAEDFRERRKRAYTTRENLLKEVVALYGVPKNRLEGHVTVKRGSSRRRKG